MAGIYIHIPFCKQACSYCDFYFVTRQEQKQQFVDELIKEIISNKDSHYSTEPVKTIYFGGGTPSLLSIGQVKSIMEAIENTFTTDLKEVTLEMNPDDVTSEFLEGLHQCGITRASMGVQSFDADLLKFMNRAHSSEEALRCLELLKNSKFDVFTVDLIYGNPGQTIDHLQRDIDKVLSFNPPHISAYSLTIEPRTRLGRQVKLGRLIPPDDDLVADHFDLVSEKLAAAGLQQYEVSNFAIEGKEAVHNSSYWQHENYLGFGPGAHSFWWDKSQKSAKRWSNKPNLFTYLDGEWQEAIDSEYLELAELAEERIMLSLRTKKGISNEILANQYEYRFSENQYKYLQKMSQQGKVEMKEHIRLTKDGLRIADSILLDLLTA